MAKFLRHNEVVALTWEERFEPVLRQLDGKFRKNSSHILLCSMRAILLLLKEGEKPTAAQVLARVREEDEASPRGARVGYDEGKWFCFMAEAVEALKTDNPLKAVGGV